MPRSLFTEPRIVYVMLPPKANLFLKDHPPDSNLSLFTPSTPFPSLSTAVQKASGVLACKRCATFWVKFYADLK